MRFYEIVDDYYALIKASSKEEAMDLYNVEYADESSPEEVNRDYALVMFSRAIGEDGEDIPVHEVLRDFNSNESMVLLVSM